MSAAVDPVILSGATREEADRLRKAREALARREAELRAAQDQADAARASMVAADLDGRSDAKAAEASEAASRLVEVARTYLEDLAREVAKVEREVLGAIQDRNAAPIEAELAATRAAYDDELDLFQKTFPIAEAMGRHRAKEAELAGRLAAVRGTDPAGARYRSIPDAEVGFWVVRDRAREDIASAGHLGDKLRRREG